MNGNYNIDDLSHIQAILHNLDLLNGKISESRRKRERFRFRYPLDIYLLTAGGPITGTVHTRNLSTGGIGFITRRLFGKGTYVVFCMSAVLAPAKIVLCRISFSRHVSGGIYDVGAEFVAALNDPLSEHNIPEDWFAMAANDTAAPVGR